MQNNKVIAVALFASIALAGCGRDAPESTTESSEATQTTPPASEPLPPAAAQPSTRQEVSLEDIDRWQRGLQAELQAVRAAAAKLAEAKDDDAKLEALSAATEMNTIDAGADAAGVDRDRYRRIRNTLSNAVSQLSPIEMEMDVKAMPAEMVEQMKQARAESAAALKREIPEDVLAALQARAAELREQDKLLVAERLKVATSAR